jgi:hypothetical protein
MIFGRPSRLHATPLLRLVLSVVAAVAIPAGFAQKKPDRPDKTELREIKREMLGDPAGLKPKKGDRSDDKPGRPSPAEADARALERLREHLEVPDDAEWGVIVGRVQEVVAARAALGLPVPNFRAGPPPGDKGKKGGRPEQDALRTAVRDKLPDAEVKARLARAHEMFERNQARVNQAHANLRAVLTVRQEAVAVVAGLLPP